MSTSNFTLNPVPTLNFCLRSASPPKFAARVGQIKLTRHAPSEDISIEIPTPGLVCSSSRGVVQHLSRDNVRRTHATKWVHVPFESFLQVNPPAPLKQGGINPLHTFLGFPPKEHILSMSLRDPSDGRDVPANGNQFVAAQTSRGSRKVSCPVYLSYVTSVLPDIAFAMSDIPFTPPPHSQKRTSKSIERSAQWILSILKPLDSIPSCGPLPEYPIRRLNVFVHMAGGIKDAARASFATMLREPLDPKEKQLLKLDTLDQGISGYTFDLMPLRISLLVEEKGEISLESLTSPAVPHRPLDSDFCSSVTSLMRNSLDILPAGKPRLVNTALSPHEMLLIIRDVGVDLFDTFWVQQAATWGVALDFIFPIPSSETTNTVKQHFGHNLYHERYASDLNKLADSFFPELGSSNGGSNDAACPCGACSPIWNNEPLIHSIVDELEVPRGTRELAPPYTRGYIHHLLHTHEMSAHALLVMHNLTVLDSFMQGVRRIIGQGCEIFSVEVERFIAKYDATFAILDEARASWLEVDLARGKGRLARERGAARIAAELDIPAPTVEVIDEVSQG